MKLILTHQNADFDAVASLLAASKLYPDYIPVLPQRLNRNVHEFITLYQNGLPLKKWDDIITDSSETVEEIILVDTQTLPDAKGLKSPDVPLLIIDHHPRRVKNSERVDFRGDIIGATATLLCEDLHDKHITLNSLEATLLALGIYEDTGSFTYDGTSPRDIRMAGWLVSLQAALDTLRRFLSPPLGVDQQEILEQLVKNVESRVIHGYTIIVSTAVSERYVEQINSVAHRLRDILDPGALVVLVNMPGGIQMVCRANGDVLDVGEIARHFGGGGHPVAAAAHIEDETLANISAEVWSQISPQVKPMSTVADLMSHGTQTIDANAPLTEIIQQMRRIGHEGFPVLEDGNLVGLLTRRDADRALEHQLNKTRVRDVMHSGKISVKPSDSVSTLEQLMVDSGWGQIPVVDENEALIGIVTRTDLIKHWAKHHPETQAAQPPAIDRHTIADILGTTFVDLMDAIAETAQAQALNVYMVGGVVRDLLLKRPNYDIDFVVEEDAIPFVATLVKSYGGTFSSFEPFGTAKWLLDNSVIQTLNLSPEDVPHHIDFATSRNEFYERPTALPTVYSSSIKLDLHRRDFTINTLAVQISPKAMRGRILDFYNGINDLNNGLIRVLHSLSFIDDPTRILRAVRFEERLQFTIEARTQELIDSARPMLGRITGERIRNELTLLLGEQHPENGFRKLEQRGILRAIHVEFKLSPHLGEYLQRVKNNLHEGIIAIESTRDLLWHFILIAVKPSAIGDVCKRLLFSREMTNSIEQAVQFGHDPTQFISLDAPFSQLTKHLSQISEMALAVMLIIHDQPEFTETIKRYLTEWRYVKATTTGHNLRELGLKPGPQFKTILDRLRDARLNGEIKTDAEEIRLRDSLILELKDDRI